MSDAANEPIHPHARIKAIQDVAYERLQQIEKGWTPEHDAQHGIMHLTNLGLFHTFRAQQAVTARRPADLRRELVQTAALAVAAIELLDTKGQPS